MSTNREHRKRCPFCRRRIESEQRWEQHVQCCSGCADGVHYSVGVMAIVLILFILFLTALVALVGLGVV